MYEAQGGFNSCSSCYAEDIRYTFDIIRVVYRTFEKVLDDFICLEYGAVEDYFDAEDSKFKSQYLDPARLIAQFPINTTILTLNILASVTNWTISNLRNNY